MTHADPEAIVQMMRTAGIEDVQAGASLARFTSARVGGPADVLVTVRTGHALAEAVKALWAAGIPFRMLGGGSNVLVADKGLRGVVIVNKADQVRFGEDAGRPMVEADAGASFGGLGSSLRRQGSGRVGVGRGDPGDGRRRRGRQCRRLRRRRGRTNPGGRDLASSGPRRVPGQPSGWSSAIGVPG